MALGVFSLGYGQGNDKILKATYTCHVILSEKGDFDTVLYADDTHSQFVFDQKYELKCKTTKNNVISSYKEDYFFDRKIREDRVLDDLDRLFQN